MNYKTIYRLVLVGVLGLSILSCELTELDSIETAELVTDTGAGEIEEVDEHNIPSSVPADQAETLEFLTNSSSKIWNAASFTLQGLDGFQQCRLDDVIVFDSDGSYVYDGGEELCGAEDDTIARVGEWTLSSDGTTLTLNQGTSDEFTAQIIGLVEDRIALSTAYMGLEVIGVYQTN